MLCVLCESENCTLFQALQPSPQLFPQVTKVLKLGRVQEVSPLHPTQRFICFCCVLDFRLFFVSLCMCVFVCDLGGVCSWFDILC